MTTLQNVLRINALSSGITGLGLAFLPRLFAYLFNVTDTAPFVGVGIFLVCFAIGVAVVSIATPLNARAVLAIVVADGAWVIGSLLLVILQPFEISLLGNIMIGAVAAWVLLMAVLQFRGVRSLRAA